MNKLPKTNKINKTSIIICGLLLVTLVLLCYLLVTTQISYKETFLSSATQPKKIAFCFMIYDKIANHGIWEQFFKNVDTDKYTIFIHYKENSDLGWFNNYKISDSVETCWGCYSLITAQLVLAKHALADPNVSHCIWLSGSCLPMKPFDHIYGYLDHNKSYFNKSPDNQVFPRCNKLVELGSIDKKHIKKGAMQSVLNRSHTQLLVDNEPFIESQFSKIKIPDEIAFITTLFHLGKESELVLTNNQTFGATTYTCWTDMTNHREFSESKKTGQPYNFSYICDKELKTIMESPSLFARKFADGCEGLEPLRSKLKLIGN